MSESDHYKLALQLIDQRKFEAALTHLLLFLTDHPQHDMAWTAIGICYYNLQKATEAIENLEMAVRFNPNNASALISLAVCYSQLGVHDKATKLANEAFQLAPTHAQTGANWAYILTASTDDRTHIKRVYAEWGRRFADPTTKKFHKTNAYKRSPDGKLRVGFVSGDIRQHSVLYFTMPFFQNYDKSRLEVYIYQTLPEDSLSEQVRGCVDQWRNVFTLNDTELYETIRTDQIDVLIDLSGHTSGERLQVFAMKPALVQMTWLGYMNTLGMKAIDYRITDWGMDPEGSDEFYVEKLLRVSCMAMYWPPPGPTPPHFLPAQHNGHITLIAPNHRRKLNDFMLQTWEEILKKHPQVRLVLICPSKNVERDALFLNEQLSVYPALSRQLALIPYLSLEDFMSLAYVADLALDSYPISGGTTTFHALWMGLPVITLNSDNPTSSSSARTLEGVGLNECVAQDRDDYIRIVSDLIENPERLLALREKTHSAIKNSPLMDYQARVDEITTALETAWKDAARLN